MWPLRLPDKLSHKSHISWGDSEVSYQGRETETRRQLPCRLTRPVLTDTGWSLNLHGERPGPAVPTCSRRMEGRALQGIHHPEREPVPFPWSTKKLIAIVWSCPKARDCARGFSIFLDYKPF